jgi:hypothetical protein
MDRAAGGRPSGCRVRRWAALLRHRRRPRPRRRRAGRDRFGRGTVQIDRAAIAEARLVDVSTAAQLDLERIAAEGWRAAETEWIGAG